VFLSHNSWASRRCHKNRCAAASIIEKKILAKRAAIELPAWPTLKPIRDFENGPKLTNFRQRIDIRFIVFSPATNGVMCYSIANARHAASARGSRSQPIHTTAAEKGWRSG
jgi:hypothetical protein